jgi:DNA modification methylase
MPLPEPYFQTELGTLYCADCLDVLTDLPEVDLVVTDPPYGVNATTGRGGKFNGFSIIGDQDTSVRDTLLTMINCKAIIFGSPKIKRPNNYKAILIWAKGEHTGMGDLSFPWKPDYEEIYIIGNEFSGKRTSSILRYSARTDSGRHHPTEKPVALILDLLRKAPSKIVLDPFIGSGTTAVACERLDRRWIGIEISEANCAIAKQRIINETSQLKLFPKGDHFTPEQGRMFKNANEQGRSQRRVDFT